MDSQTKQFLTAVDQAPLTPAEKAELRQLVSNGVSEAAWRRFDDLLVVALETRRGAVQDYRSLMDEEVMRYTKAYEDEKRVIDQQMRQDLENCTEDDTERRTQLWDRYYARIAELQQRVLAQLKSTSQTTLQKVVATVGAAK